MENWRQFKDETNISSIWECTIQYNILNYSSNILTYEQIDTQVNVYETNLSYIPSPFEAHIGRTFIKSENVTYYNEVWVEEIPLFLVYYKQFAFGTVSSEIRSAGNYIFRSDIISKFENVTIDILYDETTDNLTYVYGDVDRIISIYVEYDSNWVLVLHRYSVQSQCETYQSGTLYTFGRVNDFEFTDPLISTTNFYFEMMLLTSLTMILVFKKNRKNKKKIKSNV